MGEGAADQGIARTAVRIKSPAPVARRRNAGRVARKTSVMKRNIGKGIQRNPAAVARRRTTGECTIGE